MKISQAVASTIIIAITEALQQGEIDEYGWVKFPEGWEGQTLTALGDEFSKSLSKALDGSSLTEFVRDFLRQRMVETETATPKSDTKITRLKCFSDALGTARVILASLQALPVQYRLVIQVTAELSQRLSRDDIDVQLSDRLFLRSGSNISPSFKTRHENTDIDRMIRGCSRTSSRR